jgi:hypothetical protein
MKNKVINNNILKQVKLRIKIIVAIVFLVFLIFPIATLAKTNLKINEIFPNPKGNDKGKEFIEIYNSSNDEITLENFKIERISKKGVIKKYSFKKTDKIKGKKYFKIKTASLNNDGAIIKLIDTSNEKDEEIDKIKYDQSQEEKSYNCNEDDEHKKWYWAEATPGEKNAINPASIKYPTILLSELLPNPSGEEKEKEFIEIYNPNKKTINLKNWELRDKGRTGKYIFGKGAKIKSGEFVVLTRKEFKFALNNSGGEEVRLIAPSGETKSKISYKSAKENLSYNLNLPKKNWRWSKFITPGKVNKFNNLPTFKISKPNKVYKDVYANFSINKLRDADGDKVKIVWNFGDGHKSYLKKTRHKYNKKGKYKVSVNVKDGSEDIKKEFDIEVKKYPKYKLKIVSIMPNPDGKDAGQEIISIKNLSKKNLNLENYKIATGRKSKKATEHPFYEKFKIKHGETKKLRNNKVCKFNLLNKKGVIQLLYPNGEVADEVKYDKNKILPNEIYKLNEKGEWQWQGGTISGNNKAKSPKAKAILSDNGFNKKIVDLTINRKQSMCNTKKQLKIINYLASLQQNSSYQKIMDYT